MRSSRDRPLVTAVIAAALSLSTSAAIQQQPSTMRSPGKPKILRFARAWDGSRVVENATIVVDGDRIVGDPQQSVGRADRSGGHRSAAVHRAAGPHRRAHAHDVRLGWAPARRRSSKGSARRPNGCSLAVANARKTLETGVTTVRDSGAGGGLDLTIRDQIAAGPMIGPRMFVSGQGISAGRGGGAPDPAAMQQDD